MQVLNSYFRSINKRLTQASGRRKKELRSATAKVQIAAGDLRAFIGQVPENCTIARIVPLFEKGERDKPTNYRPISILTCFSKIFEGLLYKRVNNFLNKRNVIINSQYGFESKVSTNHAFVDVITHSYDNINSNQYTGLVFLDLTKAFDPVTMTFSFSNLNIMAYAA